MGGYGLPRISHAIQNKKIALLERISEHGDDYTMWAAEALKKRGTTETLQAPCLNRIRPGYWFSSVVEYSLEGGSKAKQTVDPKRI